MFVSWALIFITGIRSTGAEVFGGKIWWNNLRPIHAILYATFGYLAYNKSKSAYKPLVLDAIIGLISFVIYHLSRL